MTHLYMLLVGGIVIPGADEADASAISWAADTVIALGSDEIVRGISRGDSHMIDLHGATVVPLSEDGSVHWPVTATLEVGGRADLAVVSADPRRAPAHGTGDLAPTMLAIVRSGRVVAGALPGASAHSGRDHGH